jgi:hypothetical protein
VAALSPRIRILTPTEHLADPLVHSHPYARLLRTTLVTITPMLRRCRVDVVVRCLHFHHHHVQAMVFIDVPRTLSPLLSPSSVAGILEHRHSEASKALNTTLEGRGHLRLRGCNVPRQVRFASEPDMGGRMRNRGGESEAEGRIGWKEVGSRGWMVGTGYGKGGTRPRSRIFMGLKRCVLARPTIQRTVTSPPHGWNGVRERSAYARPLTTSALSSSRLQHARLPLHAPLVHSRLAAPRPCCSSPRG